MAVMATESTAQAADPHRRGEAHTPRTPRLWMVVLAACAGQFLVVLDVSVVNVALPDMRRALGLSTVGLQWVVNSYTLTFAGFMLLGGRMADLFGRKSVFLAGLALFTLASLGGGLAQEPWQLIGARLAQGMGAAVLAPASLTLLTTTFESGPARARVIGTWTAVGAGGGAAGSLVGGVLTEGLSWRWVLLINVPVGALVLLLAALVLVERRQPRSHRLDVPGAVLVTVGLGALAFGIVRTEESGWTSAWALGPLLGGLALLALFLWVESRSPEPLMPLDVFRVRAVSAANLAILLSGASMFSMWYFLSLHMQNVLGYGPLRAGIGFVPMSLSIVLGAQIAPRLMPRTGAKNLALLGALTSLAGYCWQSAMTADGGYVDTVGGPGVLMSLGVGLMSTSLATVATSRASTGNAGLVSGITNTARTMGGALGLALLSTVAAARIDGADDPASLAAGYGMAFRTGTGMLLALVLLMWLALPRDRQART
ncbi:MFS transporter [Streptomyces sp. NPDC005438]|uniref:MFS transporter n=1 Tax=Streptomyces sp. NPDC005438 TaxID=3156880 RepID=UPI0033AFFFDC